VYHSLEHRYTAGGVPVYQRCFEIPCCRDRLKLITFSDIPRAQALGVLQQDRGASRGLAEDHKRFIFSDLCMK